MNQTFGRVTLVIDPESRSLYEGAIRALGLEAKFGIEDRPIPDWRTASDAWTQEVREWAALREGERTLRKIREYMREHGKDDPQRAYWREAQRRHRAVSRGR